jgi:hypothetical protein
MECPKTEEECNNKCEGSSIFNKSIVNGESSWTCDCVSTDFYCNSTGTQSGGDCPKCRSGTRVSTSTTCENTLGKKIGVILIVLFVIGPGLYLIYTHDKKVGDLVPKNNKKMFGIMTITLAGILLIVTAVV